MEHFRCFRRLAVFLAMLAIASVAQANTPPVAQCTSVTAGAGPNCVAAVSIDNGSYDPDGDPVTITQTPPGPYSLGATLVTLTITDNGGLWDQCQATVTVNDVTPPVIHACLEPTQVDCIGSLPIPQEELIEATDNCDTGPTVIWVGDFFFSLSIPPVVRRTYMAQDDYENQAFCQQFITVDNQEPPYFTTCPADITIGCQDSTDPSNTGQATAEDGCNADPDIWYVDEVIDGDCPYEMTINRTWHINDNTGDPDVTCLQVITVADDLPPQLTCPDPLTFECLTDIPDPDVGLLTAVDDCDPSPVIEFVSDEQQSGCPIIVTRTYRATDVCNNSALCTQIITVEDLTNPVILSGPPDDAFECLSEIPDPDPGLIVATDNCDADLLIEHLADVSDGGSCRETITRTYRVADDCDNSALFEQRFIIRDLTSPVCTAPVDQTIFLCEPQTICLDFEVSDNCSAELALQVTDGPGDIVAGQWCYEATGSTSFDVTIRATDICDNYCEGVFHVDITINTFPQLTNCPDSQELHWGETFSYGFLASDPDIDQTLTFSLCDDAPAGVSIDETTGQLTWVTTGSNICDGNIGVIAADNCGAADTCQFAACVTNAPPVFECPGDQAICYGSQFEITLMADDPDSGPEDQLFYLVDGPSGVTIDPQSGLLSWLEPEAGSWDICAIVTDGAAVCDPCSPANADTCCFVLDVMSLDIVIEKVHGQIQGQYTEVDISFMHQGNNWPIGGFDFLIQYDASALSFVLATGGQFFLDCEWEYFTYRFGAGGNCAGGCPSGVLRVMAVAESSAGTVTDHPDCFTNDGEAAPGPGSSTASSLAVLKFLVSNDRTLECNYVPIRFVWYDCGDNGLSSLSGDTLYVSNMVFDYADEGGDPPVVQWNEITGQDDSFPTTTGIPSFACEGGVKNVLETCANFYNGGIDIICADSIDAVGDINLNGIAFEIADAVMFINYFVDGLAAFGDHVDGSIAASDANRDGLTLSVADLVHIIRVVVGDALPLAKSTAGNVVQAAYSITGGILSVSDDIEIAAAALVVRGYVEPELLADHMTMRYQFDGINTNIIIISPLDGACLRSFHGAFLGGITGQVLSIDMATSTGQPVVAGNIPDQYQLDQNYPNPFNPATTIAFSLAQAGRFELTIYNIQGQTVGQFCGTAESAGVYYYDWDAGNLASGVYLYRLESGGFTKVRKMLLLK